MSFRSQHTGVIVEAKNEYTRQLVNLLQPLVYEAMIVLYSAAVDQCDTMDKILPRFDVELANIPKWNNEVVKQETRRIEEHCEYLNDLITAVVVSNVKILTSVRLGKKKKKTKISVPAVPDFIHLVYINLAKELRHQLDLFDADRFNVTVTNNLRSVYALIELAVQDSVRCSLPLQTILESSFLKPSSDSDSETDVEPEEASFAENSDDTHAEFDHETLDQEPVSDSECVANNPPEFLPDDSQENFHDRANDDPAVGDTQVDEHSGLMHNVINGPAQSEIKEVAIAPSIKSKPQTFF